MPNDNFVDPGANYYFLRDPSQAFNASTNSYIGNLGTPEGNDPNTLRSPPQTLFNLQVEGDLAPRLTATVEIVNLLGNFAPTALQTNLYLIGPPGYVGGNPLYNDGVTQAVSWTYGRSGYVPQSYPMGRTVQLKMRYRV